MSSQFKVIGILGRVRNPQVKETLRALINYLKSLNQEVVIDSETAEVLESTDVPCVSREELRAKSQLIVVVGGDGSLLHAVHAVVDSEIPVLGINRGRLGFLTDILPSEIKKIKMI